MSSRIETDTLAELIAEKRDVLEKLRQLSRQQLDQVVANDLSKLMTVLAAKDALLKELQRVESGLHPFRSQDPESRLWRTTEARRRCQQTAERCESLLAEIVLLEKQSETELKRKRDDTAARLDGAHAALEARRAYSTAANRPAHLDLSSEG